MAPHAERPGGSWPQPVPPSAPVPVRKRKRPPLLRDVWNGAVRGDFAREIGWPGVLTQIVFGFLPGIGTLCAMRDFLADWRRHDGLGALLNLLAFVPFLGGFPKAADALHNMHHIARMLALMNRPSGDQRAGRS